MEEHSYQKILKVTSLFGSVQLLTAITGILKTKCIALFLGANGIGIYGVLQSTLSIISTLSNIGLNSSAVREIAQNEDNELNLTLNIIRKCAIASGITGLLFTILFARQLSLFIFNSPAYSICFIWLSLAILFDQLSSANLAILQGLRQLNYLAKANIAGGILGLTISVPIFFIFGERGITPVLMLTSLTLLLRSWYYARKIPVIKMPVSWTTCWRVGGNMIKLGITMTLTGVIGIGCTYLFRIWLSRIFGFEAVGYFNAAFLIIEGYVAMFFTAMSTDYFPRLSKIHTEEKKRDKLVNEQSEIGIILLTPLLIILITLSDLIICLLYSSAFLPASAILKYSLTGVLFKAISFPFSYVFIAKSDKKLFFFEELFSWSYILLALILSSHYGGIDCIGIGYSIGYFFSAIQSILLNKYIYHTQITKNTVFLASGSLILLIVSLLASHIESVFFRYLLFILLITGSCLISFYILNKRTGCWQKIQRYIARRH